MTGLLFPYHYTVPCTVYYPAPHFLSTCSVRGPGWDCKMNHSRSHLFNKLFFEHLLFCVGLLIYSMSYSRKHLTSLLDIQETTILKVLSCDGWQVENRSWKGQKNPGMRRWSFMLWRQATNCPELSSSQNLIPPGSGSVRYQQTSC